MISIKDIWLYQREKGEDLSESALEMKSGLSCRAVTNGITTQKLFIIRVSAFVNDSGLKRRVFQGVSIELLDFTTYKELTILLLDPALDDIFSLFIENLYENIRELDSEESVIRVSSNIIFRWKKLFNKMNNALLSPEQQRGLLGELLFLQELITSGVKVHQVIENWFGPELYNKDFVFCNTGFEVKTTVQNRPAISVSHEKQLDIQELSSLYLKLYILDEIKGEGVSLNELVQTIMKEIGEDFELISLFNFKLLSAGYNHADAEEYTTTYLIIRNELYSIKERFPKITRGDLPAGVFGCEYHIDITVLNNYVVDTGNLFNLIYG